MRSCNTESHRRTVYHLVPHQAWRIKRKKCLCNFTSDRLKDPLSRLTCKKCFEEGKNLFSGNIFDKVYKKESAQRLDHNQLFSSYISLAFKRETACERWEKKADFNAPWLQWSERFMDGMDLSDQLIGLLAMLLDLKYRIIVFLPACSSKMQLALEPGLEAIRTLNK